MNAPGAIITYVMTWWLIFFMALPFGVAPEEHPVPGTVESAPARPYLLRKVLITTVLAVLATCAIAWLLDSGLIDLRPH